MKTSEFIERVEKLGYKTKKMYSGIIVYGADNLHEPVAWVDMYYERQLSIGDSYYDLIKLLVEYAETPIDEREDDKKYYVKVFNNYMGYLNFNCNTGEFITSYRKQNNKYQTQFTESEIEQLKQRDDIPIDWDKVKLIEVEDE